MSKNTTINRRSFVKMGLQVPLVSAAAGMLAACGDGEEIALCADPNMLSFGENSIRQANKYAEVSEEPDKNCLNCAFFTPEPAGPDGVVPNCGDCSIFEGLASKNGYCDSWSTKDTGQG
ncbi:MAG: high-potential iron-sulfur protein [Rhodospirillaceae bacterium]|nr:high-potential iron-sulfur protein [Rhodospirillaceae bacterium]